jgi:tRNA threonylcarbamoyladenosine biosynthesis protein TsaB
LLKLALDTATDTCSIAIGKDSRDAATAGFQAGRSHLELLLPAIDELLREVGASVEELDGIVTGIGPGTFSGLRVGVSTARALAQALEMPLQGTSSLSALAHGLARGADDRSRFILPVIDAKRGQVFVQLFRKSEEGKNTAISEIMCLNPDDAGTLLAGMDPDTVLAGGNGVVAHFDEFTAADVFRTYAPEDGRHIINAVDHLDISEKDGKAGLSQLAAVVPVYVREPDADRTALLRKREEWLR